VIARGAVYEPERLLRGLTPGRRDSAVGD
jgi:hypothetical protein